MRTINKTEAEELSKLAIYRNIVDANKRRTEFVKRVNSALKNVAIDIRILEIQEGYCLNQDPEAFYREPEQALETLLSYLNSLRA